MAVLEDFVLEKQTIRLELLHLSQPSWFSIKEVLWGLSSKVRIVAGERVSKSMVGYDPSTRKWGRGGVRRRQWWHSSSQAKLWEMDWPLANSSQADVLAIYYLECINNQLFPHLTCKWGEKPFCQSESRNATMVEERPLRISTCSKYSSINQKLIARTSSLIHDAIVFRFGHKKVYRFFSTVKYGNQIALYARHHAVKSFKRFC